MREQKEWKRLAAVGDSGLEIGRTEGDYTFPDNFAMAARHAKFLYESEALVVRDLGSRNGIYRKLTEPVPLTDGQFFRIGNHLIQFKVPELPLRNSKTDQELLWSRNFVPHGVAVLIGEDETESWRIPLFKPVTTFGRDNENTDIGFAADGACSRKHAVVHYRNGQHWLEDVGSQNGTYIRLGKQSNVAKGDLLLLGILPVRVTGRN